MLHELTAGEAGLLAVLFPHLAGLDLDHVEDLGEGVRIVARTRTASLMALTGSPQCCSVNLPGWLSFYITRLVMCSHGLCRRVVVVS